MSDEQSLIDAAVAARASAHAPYSGFRVGAAVRLRSGDVFTGVNVENSSYGLTVCAERNAVAAAVCAGARPFEIDTVVIAADADRPTPPCGACRQVLAELAASDAAVILFNVRDNNREDMTLGDLLPHAFAGSSLP